MLSARRRPNLNAKSLDFPAALFLGWLADRGVGDPRRGHPVAGFGRAATALERRIYRNRRTEGSAYVLASVGAAAAAAAVGTSGAARLGRWGRLGWSAIVVWAALGGRSLERSALDLAAAIEAGDLVAARRLLPALVGRDPSGLGAAELCRAGIESVAENTADAVTGPLLWGTLAGPAGVAGYRAANTLDAMVGHRSPTYERFGWAAARLDDVATWPAARLAAGLAVVLAPLAGGDARRAWVTLRRDGARHPSPNAGRMEAAFAGALGVRLGGTNSYEGRVEERPLLGDGPEPGPADLRRAVVLSRATGWASALVCCAACLLRPCVARIRRSP